MQIDVSGVQPEAQRIVERAARIFVSHLRQSLVSIVAHGSAVKGGYIPFGSDIDFNIIVAPDLVGRHGELPLNTAIEMHRDLAVIDPAPFRYLQARAHPVGAHRGAGLIPGAYHVVYGDAELTIATDAELRRNARTALARLDPAVVSAQVSNRLLDHGEDRLHRELRYLCTDIWPTLYHVVSLNADDAVTAWGLTKQAAIACIDAESGLGRAIRLFYTTIVAHYRDGETVDSALASLEQGVAFLDAAAQWYQTTGAQSSDFSGGRPMTQKPT